MKIFEIMGGQGLAQSPLKSCAPDTHDSGRYTIENENGTTASGAHLDLDRAPYALYGVKYIDLVSLDLDRARYVLCRVNYMRLVSLNWERERGNGEWPTLYNTW